MKNGFSTPSALANSKGLIHGWPPRVVATCSEAMLWPGFKGQIPKMQRNHFVAEAEEPKTSYWQYALPVLSDLYFR